MTNDDKPAFQPLPIIENLHAPDIYANEATFFCMDQACINITLTTFRIPADDPAKLCHRVVIGHLIMPIYAARIFATSLLNHLDQHAPVIQQAVEKEPEAPIPPGLLN